MVIYVLKIDMAVLKELDSSIISKMIEKGTISVASKSKIITPEIPLTTI